MADPAAPAAADAGRGGVWRFGDVLLDEQTSRLQVADATVELDRSSYDVLLALLRHAGEVVTKDELLEAGWPGRVVSDNSLAKAISRLRQALGPDGSAVRSVHGYGYRLAAAVQFAPSPTGAGPARTLDAGHLHVGDPVPFRPGWRLERRLGQGAAGVIFLAQGPEDAPPRAVKFAGSLAGLHSLKREIALTRYVRTVRPELDDVAPVLGWNLAQPPFFLERPFHPHGDLAAWAASRGGLETVDRDIRLQLAIGLCDTVGALHELGVLHRDLKPENLFPIETPGGGWQLVLSDLGAGEAAPSPELLALGLTLTRAAGAASEQAGSVLYMAPEVIAGEISTQRSDVFALGVLLYQLVVGNLRRSLAPGWEAEIDDPLLREDIALAAAANPDQRLVDARGLADRLRALDTRRAARSERARRDAEAERQARQLARLSRRRRLLLAGSAILAAVLAVSLWQQQRMAAARARAELAAHRAQREADRSRALVAFLTDGVLRQADPFADPGAAGATTLRAAIDRAAGDVGRRFGGDPAVAAAIHGTLGAAYEGMNAYPQAVAQYGRQLAALRRDRDADPADIARAAAALCTARHWEGDLPQATAACERARREAVRAGLPPDWAEVFLALGDTRRNHYRQALQRIEPRLARIRASGDDALLGYALWFAGIAYGRLGKPVEMERTNAELLDVRRRQIPGPSMQLAWALTEHGASQLVLGREAAGRAELARAIETFAAVAGPAHPHAQAPRIRLAQHALALGHWQEARGLADPAYRVLHRETGWQNWTISAALAAMEAAAEGGDARTARALMRAFDGLVAQGLDRDFPYLREPHWSGYAATLLALGDATAAAGYVERLRTLAEDAEASPLLQARVACFDAQLARARSDWPRARAFAEACRAQVVATAGAASPLASLPARLLADLPAAPAREPAGR